MRIQLSVGIWVGLLAGACAVTSSDGEGDQERGPLGKADLVGSCEDACGEQAPGGNCFCDDQCETFQDCCADKADECGGGAPQECGGFLGLPCPEGLICVDAPDDACDPNRGGADCGGICVVPDHEDPKECMLGCVVECETTLGCDLSCQGCFELCADECGTPIEEPQLCTTDDECAADEFCSDVPCVPSCPLCQDCNATCQPKPVEGEPCEVSLDCGEDRYCRYDDASCGAQTGVCEIRPDLCVELLEPVCGCDGKTYDNSCFAAGAGVSIASEGPCPDRVACCEQDARPLCIEGATCCADGTWACNDGAGQPTCETGAVCDSLCFDDAQCAEAEGQTCDHSECHSPCQRGEVCPAVCLGECQ